MSCSEEKKKLIEEIGLHMEQVQQIAPLAARIYAIMILSPAEGNTFEEILEITCASKSSVSTQLNLLLQLKKVEYFTKPGERKRYFRASKQYLVNTLEEQVKTIEQEIRMVNKISQFNAENNKQKHKENGEFLKLYLKFLANQKESMIENINEMSKLVNQ